MKAFFRSMTGRVFLTLLLGTVLSFILTQLMVEQQQYQIVQEYRDVFALDRSEQLIFSAEVVPASSRADYLPKPFEPRELLARIRSVLRRSHAMPSNTQSENAQRMRFAGWTLDLTARHLLNPDGLVIMLSGAEFRLLRVFLEHPNRVLNRDQLLNLTQGRDADPFDRSVDIQISRLRQKLGEDARLPQIIKTVRNGGYVLAGQVTVKPPA